MNLETGNKRLFWDNKILGWERKNYQGTFWGSAIRNRRKLFLELAKSSIKGKVVFDYGCGSADILGDIFAMGAKKYIGCDISNVAIQEAKLKAANLGLSSKTEFFNKSAVEVENVSCDFHFSLGLWDWLDDQEIGLLVKKNPVSYLHSFSELRFSTSQLLHRLYVFSSYGRRNLTYTPRYRTEKEILNLLASANSPQIFRDSAMSFSTFAYSIT